MSIKEFIVDNFRLVDGRIEKLVAGIWVDTSGYTDQRRIRVNGAMMNRAYVEEVLMESAPPTEEEKEVFNFKKAAALQRQMDANRVERAMVRKEARAFNSSNELFNELIGLIESKPKLELPKFEVSKDKSSIIAQLTDLHFGTTISMPGSIVNTKVLSARLYAYAVALVEFGLSAGVNRVVFALTGDIVTSSRRPGEQATIEYNIAHATLNAYEVVSGMIEFVSNYFRVTHVVSVIGNEDRAQKDLELTHKCHFDNHGWVVDRMLKAHFNGSIKFSEMLSPVERLIEVDGVNILLAHGLTKPREDPARQFAYYKAKHPTMNHMLVGHIHSALCATGFSRSAGLPGSNEYSTYTLGIPESGPGQSFHLVKAGRVFSFPIDLSSSGEDYFPFTAVPTADKIATVKEVLE